MADINKNNKINTSISGDGPSSSSSSSSGGPSSSSNNNSSNNSSNTKSSGGSALSFATYGAINTKDCSTPMWMVRVPPKLADLWENVPEGTELGTLTFTKGSNNNNKRQKTSISRTTTKDVKQSLVIDVNPDLTSSSSSNNDNNVVPLEYSCEALTKKVPTYHPFSRDTTTASITVHGTITRTCNLQMMRHSSSYRKMCQNRIYQHVHSTRFVKPVDAADLTLNRRSKVAQVGFGDSIAKTGKRLLEATARVTSGTTFAGMSAATNAAAIGEKSTQGVVFDLFSQQPFWTVKELRSASGGLIPEKDIRAVLAEVAEFRRSGEHKGMWELKSEYRKLDNNNDNNSNNNGDTNNDTTTSNNPEGNHHSEDKSNNNSQDDNK